MLIPWSLDKYSYDYEQPTTFKVLLTNKSGMNAQKFVRYGFHSPIFQRFSASIMCFWSLSTQRSRDGDWMTRLRQCSHVGSPREIKKFVVATPVRPSLLSTVEAVATLVIKHLLRKLFCCNIHRLTLLVGLLLRWWWVEMKVESVSIDSDEELWQWEH